MALKPQPDSSRPAAMIAAAARRRAARAEVSLTVRAAALRRDEDEDIIRSLEIGQREVPRFFLARQQAATQATGRFSARSEFRPNSPAYLMMMEDVRVGCRCVRMWLPL
jgi:hypothetical protein